MQAKSYLSQTGRSNALVACFYLEAESELYGWRISCRGHRFTAAFFMLENFYSIQPTRLYRSTEDDVYGPWMPDQPWCEDTLRCPLPELIQHELERMQYEFCDEWLFFENDPDAGSELAAYQERGLDIQAANIKQRRLGKLKSFRNRRVYCTPGFDIHVADHLHKHFRLNDVVLPVGPAISAPSFSPRA